MAVDPTGSTFANDPAHSFWHSDNGKSVWKVIQANAGGSGVVDDTLTHEGEAADAKATGDICHFLTNVKSVNLFDKSTTIHGILNSSGNPSSTYPSSYTYAEYSALIPVEPNTVYCVSGWTNTTAKYARGVAADGTSKMKLLAAQAGTEISSWSVPQPDGSEAYGLSTTTVFFRTPATAAYVQFNVATGNVDSRSKLQLELVGDVYDPEFTPTAYHEYGVGELVFDTSVLPDEILHPSAAASREINILCFGNSFTKDTMFYVPYLLKEIDPDLKVNIYFTYMGGMAISRCLAYVSNGTVIVYGSNGVTPLAKYVCNGGADDMYTWDSTEQDWVLAHEDNGYSLFKYDNATGVWSAQSRVAAADVLARKHWDLITVQQASGSVWKTWDGEFAPYIYKLQAELQRQVGYPFKMGYIMVHAVDPTNNDAAVIRTRYDGYVEGGSTVANNIVDNGQKMMENTPVEVLLPYGTAIQNARATYLDRFGVGHLSSDKTHLVNGIGDLIGAYTNTLAIIDALDCKGSVVGSQLCPDAAWAADKGVSQTENIEGLTKYNMWVAQQCAVAAMKKPFEITNLVAKGMVGAIEIEIVNDAVLSSNPILSANSGDAWESTLEFPVGSGITGVTVTMGSSDITTTAYNSETHTVSIASVTDKVTITAVTNNS